MIENQDVPQKLYSQKSIGLATYLGGPLAASILIRRNYIVLQKEEHARYSIFIGVLTTIFLLYLFLFLIPEEILDKIPNYILPLIYSGLIYLFVEKSQGREIKLHKEAGGLFYSMGRSAGIGLLASMPLIALILGFVFMSHPNFDYKTYDRELQQLLQNEEKAVHVLHVFEATSDDTLMVMFAQGIELWEENMNIVGKMNTIENLPDELQKQNENLYKYCELRILQYEIFMKYVEDPMDEYLIELNILVFQIDQLVQRMGEE